MVQTEACRPCEAHIFSEKGCNFWHGEPISCQKKGAQKYKKYDIKMRLCTVSRFPPICMPSIFYFSLKSFWGIKKISFVSGVIFMKGPFTDFFTFSHLAFLSP